MKDLVRGIKINIIGNFFRFSRFGFVVLAAWLYGTELFGVYTVVWATAEILNRLGLLGLDHGLLFELAHFKETGETRKLYQKITSSIKACLAISCLASICMAAYAYFFVDGALIRNSLYILAPLVPLYNVGILLVQSTMGLKEMKYNAIIRSGLEPLTMMLSLFLFWKTPLKDYGVVLAQGMALLVVFVMGAIIFRRFFSWREVFKTWLRPGRYWAILQYSFPMYVIEVVDTTLFRADIFLISAVLGTGTATQMKLLGVYGFAKQIARVLVQTKNAFAPIFVPVSSQSYLQKDSDQLWAQISFATEKMLLLNIGLGLFLAGFGMEILRVFGEDAHLMSYGTFIWLLAGQFFYSTFSMVMLFLVTTQKARVFLGLKVAILGIVIAVGGPIVEIFGAWGAAMTISIGYAMISFAAIAELLRFHARNFLSWHALRIVIAGGIAALAILLLYKFFPSSWSKTISLLAATLPGILLYFILTTSRQQWRSLLKI